MVGVQALGSKGVYANAGKLCVGRTSGSPRSAAHASCAFRLNALGTMRATDARTNVRHQPRSRADIDCVVDDVQSLILPSDASVATARRYAATRLSADVGTRERYLRP